METNPGPPKTKGPPGGRPKEPTKEEIMAAMKQKEGRYWDSDSQYLVQVDSYEEKIESLEKEVLDQKEEIIKLKSIVGGMAK